MFKIRKVRNEDRYSVKCYCGLRTCYLKNEVTYLNSKKQAEGLRNLLNTIN